MDQEEEKQLREYSLDEATDILHQEVPSVGVNRNTVYYWVVRMGKAEYRSFPRTPGSSRKIIRVTANGMQQLIDLCRKWDRQVKGESNE